MTASCSVVEPSLEDVFLDIAERSAVVKALAVAVKEIRQICRDRRTLTILLFVPAFFLLLYGYALNFDIRNIPLAVQDNDRSSASRERHLRIRAFRILRPCSGRAEQRRHRRRARSRRRAGGAGHSRADSAATPRRGEPTSLQFIISGDNANTATTVMGYAVGLVGAISARYEVQARRRRAGGAAADGGDHGSGTTPSFAARSFSFPG